MKSSVAAQKLIHAAHSRGDGALVLKFDYQNLMAVLIGISLMRCYYVMVLVQLLWVGSKVILLVDLLCSYQ
jgi:hypothetical protein